MKCILDKLSPWQSGPIKIQCNQPQQRSSQSVDRPLDELSMSQTKTLNSAFVGYQLTVQT